VRLIAIIILLLTETIWFGLSYAYEIETHRQLSKKSAEVSVLYSNENVLEGI
jgi:hypothetical protein